ncbi:hypothetical protein ED733_000228 [Metarhizium rileyi]|uniref:C2H2 finger domain protein n=1 Tax=Metarhizium rileyi (strain RCEF 4871) TaxID=1649241 RepID=A0A5C6FXG9_METRR|nr:hypothetical protein ED733_000228 [Metarhizium rileyi]
MPLQATSRISRESSDSSSLQDNVSVFDVDKYNQSDLDTDLTDHSDSESEFEPEHTCPPAKHVSANVVSDFGTNERRLSSTGTDPATCSGDLSNADLDPNDFLQIEKDSSNDIMSRGGYSKNTLKNIDGIQWRWNKYCEFTKRNPDTCLQSLDYGMTKGFFNWICKQKTGVNNRRLSGIKSANSLGLYWKQFRMFYEREIGTKLDSALGRRMNDELHELIEKHKLKTDRRENRCMTVENLESQAETTLSTTEKRFRIGEHRIYALLFLLLIAPSGSRPSALLSLCYGDLEFFLQRDTRAGPGSPHRLSIKFSLRFTKRFLGAKDTAFEAPSLVSPEQLSLLDIYPGEEYLLLPLKKSMNDIFVFRDTVKTALSGYELSINTPITYAEICAWTKDIGVLTGFIITTILYTLRYNTANEIDGSPSVSDALRNLILDHTSSKPFSRHYLARNVSVDTLAIVRHKEQQNTLIRQSTSVGYLASKRRPTKLTAQQSEAVNDDPRIQRLLQQRQSLRQAEKSIATRQKLGNITKELQYLRVKLRREFKKQYRQDWSRQQAVVDIERHIAGKGFEEPPPDITPAQEQNPAQRRLVEALTAPVIDSHEGERCRRNNAILAVMAYCSIEERPLLYNKSSVPQEAKTPIGRSQADEDLSNAMACFCLYQESGGAQSQMLSMRWKSDNP